MSTTIKTREDLDLFFDEASEAFYFALLRGIEPVIFWCTEDSEWIGVRPASEDDTQPGSLGRAVSVDDDDVLPLTVLPPAAVAECTERNA